MNSAVVTRSPDETMRLGRSFAARLRRGDVVGLNGPLGAGKTQFIKGVCAGLGVASGVLSPSFVLMHRYDGTDAAGKPLIVNHFDFYRIRRAEELDELGFRDLIGGLTVTLIEWADAYPELLPSDALLVQFEYSDDPDARTILLPEGSAVEA